MNNKTNPKKLTMMRSYRLTSGLAYSVYTTARSRNLSESEFVRMILIEAMDRLS
jgi:hypothetical protein